MTWFWLLTSPAWWFWPQFICLVKICKFLKTYFKEIQNYSFIIFAKHIKHQTNWDLAAFQSHLSCHGYHVQCSCSGINFVKSLEFNFYFRDLRLQVKIKWFLWQNKTEFCPLQSSHQMLLFHSFTWCSVCAIFPFLQQLINRYLKEYILCSLRSREDSHTLKVS